MVVGQRAFATWSVSSRLASSTIDHEVRPGPDPLIRRRFSFEGSGGVIIPAFKRRRLPIQPIHSRFFPTLEITVSFIVIQAPRLCTLPQGTDFAFVSVCPAKEIRGLGVGGVRPVLAGKSTFANKFTLVIALWPMG